MKTAWSLVFMVFHFNILKCAKYDNHKALIFNLKPNPSLISIAGNGSPEVECNTWVTVCPATSAEEIELNKNNSLYNAALFLKNLHTDEEDCKNVQKVTCDEPYKTSMVWFKGEKTIEFGYEIYLDYDTSVDQNFKIEDAAAFYDDYESLKNLSITPESPSFMDKLELKNTARREEGEKTELMLKGKKMEFIWISLIRVWFSDESQLQKIDYQISPNNVSPTLYCQDGSMGKELFPGVDIDKPYSKENQAKILRLLDVSPELEDYRCAEKYNCFTKGFLLSSDQFRFGTDALPISKCSNIIAVPIWKSTVEWILKKLDKYLYALSRVTGKTLQIVAGVSGTLQLTHRIRLWEPVDVNLVDYKTKFSIRVPDIIYKIVKLQTDKCPKEHKGSSTCWYGVLIIIHNNPHHRGKDNICQKVYKDDWAYIESKWLGDDPSKLIYTCEITEKSIEDLGLTHRQDTTPIYYLSLTHFPGYDYDGVNNLGIASKVYDEYGKTREQIVIKDGVIERPSIYDEHFIVRKDRDDSSLGNETDGEAESSANESMQRESDSQAEPWYGNLFQSIRNLSQGAPINFFVPP